MRPAVSPASTSLVVTKIVCLTLRIEEPASIERKKVKLLIILIFLCHHPPNTRYMMHINLGSGSLPTFLVFLDK